MQYYGQGGELQTPFWASSREVYSSRPQPVRSIPDETVKTRSKDCLRPGCQNTFRWVFCFSILCRWRADNATIIKAKMNMAPLFLAIFNMAKKSGAKPDERVPSRPGLFRLKTSAALGPHTCWVAAAGVRSKGSWRLQASAWSKLGGYRHLVSSWQAQGVIGLGWLGSKWPRTSHGKPSNTSQVHFLLRLLFLHKTILVTMSCHVCHSFLPFHDTPKLNMSSVKTTLSAVAGMFKTKRNGRNGRKATICVPRFQWT